MNSKRLIPLLLSLWLLPSLAVAQQVTHNHFQIRIADTQKKQHEEAYGVSAQLHLDIHSYLNDYWNDYYLKPALYELKDQRCTLQEWEKTYAELKMKARACDIITVFISVEGKSAENTDWPRIFFNGSPTAHDSTRSILLKTLFEQLKALPHRLLLVVNQSCNAGSKNPPCDPMRCILEHAAPTKWNDDRFKDLFLHSRGEVMISAAEEGEYAVIGDGKGGYLFRAFKEALIEQVSREKNKGDYAYWDTLARRVQELVPTYIDSCGGCSTPQHPMVHSNLSFTEEDCLDKKEPPTQTETAYNPSHTTTPDTKPKRTTDFPHGMVYVEGGTFTIRGKRVTLSSFYMDSTEVTNQAFCEFLNEMGNQEGGGTTWLDIESSWCRIEPANGRFKPKKGYGDHPVVKVSWYGAQAYAAWKSGKTGHQYSLPTEAQWEYAAGGGKQSHGYKYAGSSDLDEVGWYYNNAGGDTHPVGKKKPNELGLYDMSGNVWEWCADLYSNGSGSSRVMRVLRGGSWRFGRASYCRIHYRHGSAPSHRDRHDGFRLVRTP